MRGTVYPLPSSWISRWQLLTNFKKRGVKTLDWNLTEEQDFQNWMRLNVYMSEAKKRITYKISQGELPLLVNDIYIDLVPSSSLLIILDTMIPTDGEYLMSVRIDEATPGPDRKKMYESRGRWIRENQLEFLYRLQGEGQTHRNLGISRDPTLTLAKDSPLFQFALALPYDVLVGIIHSSYQNLGGVSESSLLEAPWWRVHWDDVRDFYFTKEAVKKKNDVIRTTERLLIDTQDSLRDTSFQSFSIDASMLRQIHKFQSNIDPSQASITHLSAICRIFMTLPITGAPTSSEEGRFSFSPSTSSTPFQDTEELSLLLSHPMYFTLLARQAVLIETRQLRRTAKKLFGLDSFLVLPISRTRTSVLASEAVGAWIRDSVSGYYDAVGNFWPRDYEYMIHALYASTSKEFMLGIRTLIQRLRDETTIPIWHTDNAELLLETVNHLLESE